MEVRIDTTWNVPCRSASAPSPLTPWPRKKPATTRAMTAMVPKYSGVSIWVRNALSLPRSSRNSRRKFVPPATMSTMVMASMTGLFQ